MKTDEVLKELVWDTAVTGVLEALFTAAPYLRVPPLKQIISWAVRELTDALYAVLDLAWDLQAIAFRNQKLKREYDAAAVALKIIRHDYGVDSEPYRKARDEYRKALADFVRIHPAA